MHEYVHDVFIDLSGQTVLWPPRKNYELYPEQGHQDQGGSHCFHVHVGLCPVSVSQLCHQHSYNIQQEEEVNLREVKKKNLYSNKSPSTSKALKVGAVDLQEGLPL